MINVNDPKLLASGDKYRKELLIMPMLQLQAYAQHMTRRMGVRGKETVGEFGSGAQLRPYRTAKDAKDTRELSFRTLETFLGDVVEEFDPYVMSRTIYGNSLGTPLENFDIVKATGLAMAKSVGKTLRQNLFKAKRNASGDNTADLFDGFSTIVDREIAAGAIADNKSNLATLEEINAANVVDMLRDFYHSASEVLQEANTKLFLPTNIYNLYKQGYLAEFGSVSYNTQYKQVYLIDSDDKCELVPVSAMAGTNHLILTDKGNMLIGCDQMSDEEKVEIRRCDNPKAVQFFLKCFFGVEFETLAAERLMVGKITPNI